MRNGIERIWSKAALLAVALLVWNATASAQSVAVSAHGGTLGVGADVSLVVVGPLVLRLGASALPWEPTHSFDQIDYTVAFAAPYGLALLDYHPRGGGFRITGGAIYLTRDYEVRARLNQPLEIGNQTYTPQQVGTLTGVFDTRTIAPYFGIGFGKPPGQTGLGLAVDLGVAHQGSPLVSLGATGPVATQAAFDANLRQEELNISEAVRPYRFYPVLSIGMVIAF